MTGKGRKIGCEGEQGSKEGRNRQGRLKENGEGGNGEVEDQSPHHRTLQCMIACTKDAHMRMQRIQLCQAKDSKILHTFWESHARDKRAKDEAGSTVPRKMVLNWFMPALANSSVGSLTGTTGLLGTAVWALVWKNSMKVLRTRSPAACKLTLPCAVGNAYLVLSAACWWPVTCMRVRTLTRRTGN